jgi:hypothetical protein
MKIEAKSLEECLEEAAECERLSIDNPGLIKRPTGGI